MPRLGGTQLETPPDCNYQLLQLENTIKDPFNPCRAYGRQSTDVPLEQNADRLWQMEDDSVLRTSAQEQETSRAVTADNEATDPLLNLSTAIF